MTVMVPGELSLTGMWALVALFALFYVFVRFSLRRWLTRQHRHVWQVRGKTFLYDIEVCLRCDRIRTKERP